MRIAIDPERCSGHGRCYSLCPELFDEDEDGYPVLISESVPDSQREKARRQSSPGFFLLGWIL